MEIQYSVEFNAVKFTNYKQGAPKELLKKVGRWQKAGAYGGWDNIDYVPQIITTNKPMYECAPDMYHKLKEMSELLTMLDPLTHANIELDCQVYEIEQLLTKARGE
tara:strand:- start:41658 stop:41975 length:318 start_codon:yes stop_codon:yes gene_type:complete